MFYRLDGSDYLFVDWEKLDACLKPTDRDKAGRLCGKRATTGGLTAGSDKAKKAAERFRAAKYGKKGQSPQQQSKTASTKKPRKFGVIEGGGKGSDEKIDPRVAKANRELRKLTSQLPAAMTAADRKLAEMKEKFGAKSNKATSKPRKPRVVDKPQPEDTPLSAPARELMRSMKETDRLLNEAKGGKPKRQRSAKPGTSKVTDLAERRKAKDRPSMFEAKLRKGDVEGAINQSIMEADIAQGEAQAVRRKLERKRKEIKKVAEEALNKYPLIGDRPTKKTRKPRRK